MTCRILLLLALLSAGGCGPTVSVEATSMPPLSESPTPVTPVSQSPAGPVPPAGPISMAGLPAAVEDADSTPVPPFEFLKGTGSVPDYPRDAIELTAVPLQEAVLPFQAVVVRVSLVNRTDKVVGPVADLLDAYFENGDPRKVKPWKTFHLKDSTGNHWQQNGMQCYKLGPRQRLTVDIALGHTTAYRSGTSTVDKSTTDTVFEPIFFDLDRPQLEACHHEDWMRQDNRRTRIPLRLAKPTGDDRVCFELLEVDPNLARRLFDIGATMEPRHVAALEKIIAAWPESSYADYARFALARAYLGGNGERLPRLVGRRPLTAADPEKADFDVVSLKNRVSPFLPEAEWKRLREALSKGSPASFHERFTAGIRAQSHVTATLIDRRKAVALIDEIRGPTFAFTAHALSLKHRVAELDKPEQLAAISREFERRAPCAREWLLILKEDYGGEGAIQPWVDFRIRTSTRLPTPLLAADELPAAEIRALRPPAPTIAAGSVAIVAGVISSGATIERTTSYGSPWMSQYEEKPTAHPPAEAVYAVAEDVRVETKASSPRVLPFQTVRVRQRVVNIAPETIGLRAQLYGVSMEVGVDGEPLFQPKHDVRGNPPITMVVCGEFSKRGRDMPLFLPPNRSMSLTYALVTKDEDEHHRPRPFFHRPGHFECRVRYPLRPVGPDGSFNESFAVEVEEPVGDDREVYRTLVAHPSAAFALTAYDYGVPEEAVPVLEDLLRRFPRSSYADYFRLALARGLWGGDAPGSNQSGYGGDGSDRYDERDRGNFGRLSAGAGLNLVKYDPDLTSLRTNRLLTSDFHTAELHALQAERDKARNAPIPIKRLRDKLSTMSGTSRERRERILTLLRQIDRERFPLAPSATYYLARTLSIDYPAAGADEYVHLATRHADAYEWLSRLDYHATTVEDWLEYRIDPAP